MNDKPCTSVLASNQTFQFLSGIIPFSFLPENEIEKIALELSLVHHPKESVLFPQGVSRIESLYIILSGAAERYYEENNQRISRRL